MTSGDSSHLLNLTNWSSEDVVQWLSQAGLAQHAQMFLVHRIDGNKVFQVDNDKLKVRLTSFCLVAIAKAFPAVIKNDHV